MPLSKINTGSIADSAITSAKVADGGIVTVDMADGSVTSLKIADGAIGTADIGDSTITTAKLADSNVTPAKLSAGAPSWDSSSNLLVVSSGNPTITLKTTGAGNNPLYRLQADTNYWDMIGVFSDSNDTLRLRYNNNDHITVTNNGNTGFGTTSSINAKVTIQSNYSGYSYRSSTFGDSTYPTLRVRDDGIGVIYIENQQSSGNDNFLRFVNANRPSENMEIYHSVEGMYVRNSGQSTITKFKRTGGIEVPSGNVLTGAGTVSPLFYLMRADMDKTSWRQIVSSGSYANMVETGNTSLGSFMNGGPAPRQTGGESINWSKFRLVFRYTGASGNDYNNTSAYFKYGYYYYATGWTTKGPQVDVNDGWDYARGYRWCVMPWIDFSTLSSNGEDVPGIGLYFNSSAGDGRSMNLGSCYIQYGYDDI